MAKKEKTKKDVEKIESTKVDTVLNDSLVALQEVLIQVGLRVAKRGEGALFIVGDVNYEPLVAQEVPSFNVLENPKLLESLALMDGAIVINFDGMLEAYGVMVKSKRVFKNFGTRHSAGMSASKTADLVIVVSEEDKKLRIIQEEKMIMQIDALQRNVDKEVSKVFPFLESVGAGTIGAVGASVVAPGLGIALFPGVVVFGSAYYLTKLVSKSKKK